jgi:prepilin-type N-terminal cleavage/methylation domain-containing protein
MKKSREEQGGRSAGFTLIELLISAVLLGLVLGGAAMISMAHGRAFHTGATVSQLEAQVQMTMERIVADLRIAGFETIAPDPVEGVGSNELSYLQARLQDGEVAWGNLRRIAFEYEDGELDDGIDNNGNDLVDEGRVVLTENIGLPDERSRVLTRWVRELLAGEEPNGIDDNGNGLVDESGFVLERVGETLMLRLTLERRNAEGRLMNRTARTSTRLRN